MSDYNIKVFDSFSKDCLKMVSEHPEFRDKTAGTIVDLVFFSNQLEGVYLDIPYDAMLRIYQHNYKRIQEILNKPD